MIYRGADIVKKRQVIYKIKVQNINVDSLVNSMNINLTNLTSDIAKTILDTTRNGNLPR